MRGKNVRPTAAGIAPLLKTRFIGTAVRTEATPTAIMNWSAAG